MLNKVTSLQVFLEYRDPIIKAINNMDEFNRQDIKDIKFQIYVKEQKKLAMNTIGKKDRSNTLEKIEKAYNIKNLIANRFILYNEGSGNFHFVKYIEDMFRELADEIKPKPITRRAFIDHCNSLDFLINETHKYKTFTDPDKLLFIDDLRLKFKFIKQDIEKNKSLIEDRADNLSSFLDSDKNDGESKRAVMHEIETLCDNYIEPFFNFLKTTQNDNSFLSKVGDISNFFTEIKRENEFREINLFMISFRSNFNSISKVYEKINDYRRKGKEDLLIFNTFESAFKNLEFVIMELQDGKMKNNKLESSNFQEKFQNFHNLKANNFKRSDISIRYDEIVDRFERIEETLSMNIESGELIQDKKIDACKLKGLMDKNYLVEQHSKRSHKTTGLILSAIKANNSSLMSKDEKNDLIFKLHKILSINIPEYDVSQVVYAYNSVRKTVGKVKVGYNERKSIEWEGKYYEYRPVYNLGGENI